MAFFNGNQGVAVVGSTTLNITGWDFEDASPALDTTHTGSSGYMTNIAGLRSGKGSVQGNWDSSNNWMSNPPNVVPGQAVAIKLYHQTSSGNYWDLTSCRITSVKGSSKVGAVVTVAFDFETTGSYTAPAGTF